MSDHDMLANESLRTPVPASIRSAALGLDRVTVALLERSGYRTVDDLERAADISLRVHLDRRGLTAAGLRRTVAAFRRAEAYALTLWHANGGPCVVPEAPVELHRFLGSDEPALA